MKPLGKVETTSRGFQVIRFNDRNGHPCSLQVSSIADFEQPGISAVWIGSDDAAPKIMWSNAAAAGIATNQQCGWVPYPVPELVNLTTRAHLRRDQVEALIGHLQQWLETDSFELLPEVGEEK